MYVRNVDYTISLVLFLNLFLFSGIIFTASAHSEAPVPEGESAFQAGSGEVLIPLPGENNSLSGSSTSAYSGLYRPASETSHNSNETLLPLPNVNNDENKITIPSKPTEIDEIVIPGRSNVAAEGISEASPTELAADATPTINLPVFPKDTSSALFMIMKTWECVDYDGHTLIEHAVNVYSQESEDHFTICGLDAVKPFKLTLKEVDVTLDELLDVISEQANIDWGVDLVQKVIYIYPTKLQ